MALPQGNWIATVDHQALPYGTERDLWPGDQGEESLLAKYVL